MINEVRNTVMYIINKENNGYITPDEFNSMANQAQLDIFEEYFPQSAIEQQRVNNRQTGTGYANLSQRLEAVIDIFNVPSAVLSYSAPSFTLPTNCYRVNHLYYGTRKIERLSHNKAINLLSSNLTSPSVINPAYTQSGQLATVYPSSITTNVKANYVRYPLSPKWTYVVAPGSDAPLFNISASDYQDFELPLSDKGNLIVRILEYCGVSIREEQITQMAKSEEIQDKQEQ